MGAKMGTHILQQAAMVTIFLFLSNTQFAWGGSTGGSEASFTEAQTCFDCGMNIPGAENVSRQVQQLASLSNFSTTTEKDSREYVSRSGALGATGKIKVYLNTGNPEVPANDGTAVLISPCLIQATYHTVFGGSVPKKSNFKKATFSVGQRPDGSSLYKDIQARPIMWGKWVSDLDDSQDNRSERINTDFVIFRVRECPGGHPDIGYYEREGGGIRAGLNVMTAGYHRDRDPNKLSTQQKFQIIGPSRDEVTQEEDGGWEVSGIFPDGSSGQPILVGTPPQMIGTIVAADLKSGRGIMAPISRAMLETEDLVFEDTEAYKRNNPQFKENPQVTMARARGEKTKIVALRKD